MHNQSSYKSGPIRKATPRKRPSTKKPQPKQLSGLVICAVIGIETFGNISIFSENGVCGAEITEKPADLVMKPLDAARFLFGPLPPYCTAALPDNKAHLLTSWLPLPLGWNTLDRV